MAGRMHEIFGLGTLLAKLEAINQLAADVFEAREDPVQLTRALPHVFQQIFCGSDGSTYVQFRPSRPLLDSRILILPNLP